MQDMIYKAGDYVTITCQVDDVLTMSNYPYRLLIRSQYFSVMETDINCRVDAPIKVGDTVNFKKAFSSPHSKNEVLAINGTDVWLRITYHSDGLETTYSTNLELLEKV